MSNYFDDLIASMKDYLKWSERNNTDVAAFYLKRGMMTHEQYNHLLGEESMKLRNIHPGEVLQEEFLTPLGMSQSVLADKIDVPVFLINEIIHGFQDVDEEIDLRLTKVLGTTQGFWLDLQESYNKEKLKRMEEKLPRLELTTDEFQSAPICTRSYKIDFEKVKSSDDLIKIFEFMFSGHTYSGSYIECEPEEIRGYFKAC